MYILRPEERSLSRCEALREALRFGATVAAGSYSTDGLAYGGRFYDAWAARLERDRFCRRCGGDGWDCAETAASRARRAQLAAAGFLQQAEALLPALRHDGRASEMASGYAQMAQKLSPYVRGSGLRGLWADPPGRSRYVDAVRRVRDLHHAIATRLANLACIL